MSYSKLQYISQGATAEEQYYNIVQALAAGCTWIQLRWKQAEPTELLPLAQEIRQLCHRYKACFIINDHLAIAQAVAADGLHLGVQDMPLAQARQVWPEGIIGATANTLSQAKAAIAAGCHYIGLGPFRFTATKENLSPILGLAAYREIISALQVSGHTIPVYAIGGIGVSDIPELLQTGIYGIALSAAISHHSNKSFLCQQINTLLYESTYDRQ